MNPTFKYDIVGFCNDLGLPKEDMANLYSEFLQEILSETSELRALLVSKDWDAIHSVIHNIKGLSANFRIMDIRAAAEGAQKALATRNYTDIESSLHHLFVITEGASKEIAQYFNQRDLAV